MELEKIFELKIGQLRELFAYEDADDTVGDIWDCVDENMLERVGFYDEEDYEDEDDEDEDDYSYDEDDELYDEDEDYCDEEEEEDDLDLGEDEVCIGGALADPAMEELAQSIAADIRAGHYGYNTIRGLYSEEVLERIYQLI